MKTKLTSLTHWAANTPPMVFCVLFALTLSLNTWATVVTAEWGDYVSPARTFPKEANTYDEIEGIRITRSSTLTSGYVYVGGRDSYNNYQLNDVGEYVEITISSGTISSVQFCVWTANENLLKIRFCKESAYSDDPSALTGDAYYVMHDAAQAGSGLQSINAPANAKSARIYKDGAANWQCYLYRLIVTASDDCASPQTATFAAGGSGNPTGSTPDDIERCEGATFSLPDASSLTWGGYLFAGWNDGSNTYAAGASYTMPADGVDFTAQWEVDNISLRIPTISTLNYANKTGGSSDTRDFYDETCIDLYTTHYVEWEAYITPGSYQISMKHGAPYWGIRGTFSIIDPLGVETTRVFYTQSEESNGSSAIYRNPSVIYDLSGLTANKLYKIKVEHDWSGSYLSIAHIEFTPLGASQNITFAKGDEAVTGSLPANTTCAGDGSYTLPGKGDLAWSGHSFAGWNDGSTTYAAGASYTMPAHDVTFTAVWTPFTVPTVTNLAVGEAVDKEVPLSWSIPGICDLSSAVNAVEKQTGTTESISYSNDELTITGQMPQYEQFGVAFGIPATNNVEWMEFEHKAINIDDNVKLWAGVCDGTYAYSEHDKYVSTSGTWSAEPCRFTPNKIFWNGDAYIPSEVTSIKVAIYCNSGGGYHSNQQFSVRNVRYHVAGQEDIDHVIVVRKEGSAPENATDGTVYNVGTKSHFLDNDNTKEFGHKYYYSVYAVHADGTLSAATTTSHTIVATPTCNITFNIGEGTIGDAPTSVVKPANGTVTLPSIGSAYKPFYAFTGWKKNNAGDLLAAGATYTVTADDVTAENISFTAQWTEDNTTRRIPAEHILNYSNQSTSVATTDYWDVTDDGINDVCLDMRQKTAEWRVFIKPGYYDISTICAVHIWGISYRLSIVDPVTDLQVKELFYEKTSGDDSHAIIRNLSKRFDLTDLAYGKQYIIRIEDTWTGCNLLVHDINFNPVTPEEIASETVLDANNTVTTGLTEVTDVDFPGDNDQSVNLYDKKMDWVVKIAKGYYNISLLYGAPQYSTRVSVALIDPEGVEPTRWFCPDQTDRNGHYYHTSGTAGTQYYSIGLDKRDLYDIDPGKTYIVRVHDENGTSNELRVKNLTFSPVAPLNIPDVTRLDANNVVIAPSIVDSRIDISNKKEAVWYAKITPGIYDFSLNYYAETGGTKVRFGIVDAVTGDTIFRDQQNKYSADNTTYTINSSAQDLQTALDADKVYKIFVKDNYAGNGSVPQINYLEIVHHAEIHTRSGLRVGDYGTICLPYAVAAADRNGAELFELEQWADNGASLTISQLDADEDMEAGRPYLFQATANTATFSYYPEGDAAEAQTYNGLIGKYEEMEIPMNDDNYIIYNNKLYLVNSANIWVGANRAYIHKGGAPMNQAPANRRRVTLGVYGTQTATGFDPVTGNPSSVTLKYIENGHLFIIRDGKTYNAQGQVVK